MYRKITLPILFFIISFFSYQSIIAQHLDDSKTNKKEKSSYKGLVYGGQFKDLILPMPIINGLESEGLWGNENVVPRDKDNGIEDNEWCYWGGNPIVGKDSNYHIAICRWKENTGHNGWFEAEVAHCVADNPFGPYNITKQIVEKGHNPEVMRMQDGTFVLHIMDNRVFKADKMEGPWKLMGKMKLDVRGLRESNHFGSNLTSEFRPDGSIIVMKKDGDITLSEKDILGPYKMMSINNYTRSTGYPEDPVIWRSRHQYHAIYNHAQDRKSGYMRSIDGVHWKNEEGLPYDASTTFYTDGSKNTWYKFERPKVLQDKYGRATHLSLAVMDVAKRDEKPNDNHSSKNMIMPLVVEKNIFILNDKPITKSTKKITLKIEAEVGFNPQTDLDISSLRFGSDQVVNYGEGCNAVKTEKSGKDLVITFKGDNGINHRDFDFKLIGETTKGELVYGYAVLPGRSVKEASLIALPFNIEFENGTKVLKGAVENCGLSVSKSCKAEVREYSEKGMRILETITVNSVQPYQKKSISVSLQDSDVDNCYYEVVIRGDYHYDEYWQKTDEISSNVEFFGNWKAIDNENAFLKKEMATETLGDAVEFSFKGTRVKVYGQLGRKFGSYKVYIDGEYIETIRCNYGQVNHSPIYQSVVLENSWHTLRLEKTETEYNGRVTIDAFAVESPMQNSKR